MTHENPEDPQVPPVEESDIDNPERRQFFKRTAVGTTAALATGLGGYALGRASIEGEVVENWPESILAEDFKPFPQINNMWSYTRSPILSVKYPERNEQFGRLVKGDPNYNFCAQLPFYEHKGHDNNRPGFSQMADALAHAAWLPPLEMELRLGATGQPDTLFFQWDQSDVKSEQYQFADRKEASDAIRSAARMFGAVRCGIAKRDKRWDYDPLYKLDMDSELLDELNAKARKAGKDEESRNQVISGIAKGMPDFVEKMQLTDHELTWEKDFPFEPKTVIVLAIPMDYDAMATAPSKISTATVGDGYTKMATLACTVAKFIRGLGYQAVGAGNDLGNSVAYGIAAGLGEGGRNAQLLVPGYGPRVRLCKVYTDLEFVEYDQPRSWGITEFCKSCKKCGEACPSGAVDMADDTHYYFEGEHADQPGYAWSNHEGVKKFHTDAKKCLDYWFESDTDCGNCAAACTFNEPDYWHHWFIMAINPFMPKAIHSAMAELHPAFGYGGQTGTPKPDKVKKFWRSGEGMRVNPSNHNVFGAVGQA